MPKGFFRTVATVKNTGTQSFTAYVGLSIWDPGYTIGGASGQHPGTWCKKVMAPGESSQIPIGLICPDTGMVPKNWATGTYGYMVNLYYGVLSEGTVYSTDGGWTVFEAGTGSPDASTLLAQKTGTITVT